MYLRRDLLHRFGALAPVFVAACGARSSAGGTGTVTEPILVAPVDSAKPSGSRPSPVRVASSEASADTGLSVDGIELGSPIGVLLSRAPYDRPCDVDPIDRKRSTLYFWAAGPCGQVPAFPGLTSVAIVTPRTHERPREQQPITLVAWAGGTYFDAKTRLPIRLGDAMDRALDLLGTPTGQAFTIRNGERSEIQTISWGRIHALVRESRVAAVALGDLVRRT